MTDQSNTSLVDSPDTIRWLVPLHCRHCFEHWLRLGGEVLPEWSPQGTDRHWNKSRYPPPARPVDAEPPNAAFAARWPKK